MRRVSRHCVGWELLGSWECWGFPQTSQCRPWLPGPVLSSHRDQGRGGRGTDPALPWGWGHTKAEDWLGRDRVWQAGAQPCCGIFWAGADGPGADMDAWAWAELEYPRGWARDGSSFRSLVVVWKYSKWEPKMVLHVFTKDHTSTKVWQKS